VQEVEDARPETNVKEVRPTELPVHEETDDLQQVQDNSAVDVSSEVIAEVNDEVEIVGKIIEEEDNVKEVKEGTLEIEITPDTEIQENQVCPEIQEIGVKENEITEMDGAEKKRGMDEEKEAANVDEIKVLDIIGDRPKGFRAEKRIGNLSKLKSKIFPKKELSLFQKNLSASYDSLVSVESQPLYKSLSKSQIVLKVDDEVSDCDCKNSGHETTLKRVEGGKAATLELRRVEGGRAGSTRMNDNLCCHQMKGMKSKVGPRKIIYKGEDAFGERNVFIKTFTKTYQI